MEHSEEEEISRLIVGRLQEKESSLKKFSSQGFRPLQFYDGVISNDRGIKVCKWHSNDRDAVFKEILKLFPEYLQYYEDNPFTYTINSSGFRHSENFIEDKSRKVDVFLGCSLTFGIGVPEEKTFCRLFANKTGRDTINLGIPGAGVDHCYIALLNILNFYTVDRVYIHLPVYPRFYSYCPWEKDSHQGAMASWGYKEQGCNFIWSEHYFKNTIVNTDYMYFNHQRGIDAIEGLCKRNNIEFNNLNENIKKYPLSDSVIAKYGYFRTLLGEQIQRNEQIPIIEGDQVARDLVHPSFYYHREVCDSFLDGEKI